MTTVFRIIFVLLVLVRALPGLAASPCAAASMRVASAEPACACCGEGGAGACGSGASAGCCCGRAAPAEPAAPAGDAGLKKVDPTPVGPPPVTGWVLAPRPVMPAARPELSRSARPASAPVQALLCVWVV